MPGSKIVSKYLIGSSSFISHLSGCLLIPYSLIAKRFDQLKKEPTMNGAHSSGLEPIVEESDNHLRHHKPSMDVMRSANSSTDALDRLLPEESTKSQDTNKTYSRGKRHPLRTQRANKTNKPTRLTRNPRPLSNNKKRRTSIVVLPPQKRPASHPRLCSNV